MGDPAKKITSQELDSWISAIQSEAEEISKKYEISFEHRRYHKLSLDSTYLKEVLDGIKSFEEKEIQKDIENKS